MNYRYSLERATGIPFTKGNRVEILKNGAQIFESMLAQINEARHTIDFLTFVYWKGKIAEEFAETLAEKAREGVKVRVLLDAYGSFPMPPSVVTLLKECKAEVVWFRPLTRWKIWKSDNRTHRKILVCDNKVAFTGGVGIAEEWEGDARNPDEWRDTHYKVTGPAVEGIKSAFIENWIETGHSIDEFLEDVNPEYTSEDGALIQTISTAATVRWSNIMLLYQSLIQLAQENIKITTAYFNPDETLIKMLIAAAERGVHIEVILPGKHIDRRVSKITAGEKFNELLSAGIHLNYYQKTMMHAKVITVDGEISCVGSANFNQRSMLKDDEINLVILDKEITRTLNNHFEEDLGESETIGEQRWKKRSVGRKVLETVLKPFQQEF